MTAHVAQSHAENLLPAQLKTLAALLGSVLGGPKPSPESIDPALIRTAIHRHQVGPLLHAALLQGSGLARSDLMRDLAESYSRNKSRQASDLIRLRTIGAIFVAQGIDWMSLKGVLQAA